MVLFILNHINVNQDDHIRNLEEKKNPHFIWHYVVFNSLFYFIFKGKKKKTKIDFFFKTFCQKVIRKKRRRKESVNVEVNIYVHLN